MLYVAVCRIKIWVDLLDLIGNKPKLRPSIHNKKSPCHYLGSGKTVNDTQHRLL